MTEDAGKEDSTKIFLTSYLVTKFIRKMRKPHINKAKTIFVESAKRKKSNSLAIRIDYDSPTAEFGLAPQTPSHMPQSITRQLAFGYEEQKNPSTCIYQAKLAGAMYIYINWVANKLRRSKRWVMQNWKKKPGDCFTDFSNCGRSDSLSQETKNIIEQSNCQRGGSRELAEKILAKNGRKIDQATVHQFVQKGGCHPFH
uniref:Uncharacterized protein n=1 Tax=Romanomermis culicivorax TaxID=13658 RepID=A0A915IC33_ROMCU